MITPITKLKKAANYHYYRIKNDWTFPSNMAYKTGANIAKGTHEKGVTSLVKNT